MRHAPLIFSFLKYLKLKQFQSGMTMFNRLSIDVLKTSENRIDEFREWVTETFGYHIAFYRSYNEKANNHEGSPTHRRRYRVDFYFFKNSHAVLAKMMWADRVTWFK